MDAPVPLRTVEAGLAQPTMWITRPPETMRLERQRAGGWPEDEIEAHQATMREAFEGLRAPGYLVQIRRMSHLGFTDLPCWSPAFRWMGATGPIDGELAHSIVNDPPTCHVGVPRCVISPAGRPHGVGAGVRSVSSVALP